MVVIDTSASLLKLHDGVALKDSLLRGAQFVLDGIEKQLPGELVAIIGYSTSATLLHDFTTVSCAALSKSEVVRRIIKNCGVCSRKSLQRLDCVNQVDFTLFVRSGQSIVSELLSLVAGYGVQTDSRTTVGAGPSAHLRRAGAACGFHCVAANDDAHQLGSLAHAAVCGQQCEH